MILLKLCNKERFPTEKIIDIREAVKHLAMDNTIWLLPEREIPLLADLLETIARIGEHLNDEYRNQSVTTKHPDKKRR